MCVYETLKHTTWECKYHVVFIPKCRRKTLYGQLDHVHMLISVPPKYSVAQVMGFIKGKSAIHIARVYAGRRRNFVGQHF